MKVSVFIVRQVLSWFGNGLSREELRDISDILELSSKRSQMETDARLRDVRQKGGLPFEEVRREALEAP